MCPKFAVNFIQWPHAAIKKNFGTPSAQHLPLNKWKMFANHCNLFITFWECLSWKRITTTFGGYWSLQSRSFFLWENSATLPFVLYILVYDHLSFSICMTAPNHNSCVCLCPACCDFICRQCSLCVRSDRFCFCSSTSTWHAPLLLQPTAEPSLCHSPVPFLISICLLFRSFLNNGDTVIGFEMCHKLVVSIFFPLIAPFARQCSWRIQ